MTKSTIPNDKAYSRVKDKRSSNKDNLFESIWSRRKFDILGKKRKGEERRVGLARFRAVEKRKKTLLKEYEQSSKSSVFIDKRIGEQNDTLGEFDKAVMRSQRERLVKLSRRNKYNLSDGEEDNDIHGLGLFSGKDDFDDVQRESSDDDHAGNCGHEEDMAMMKQFNENNARDASETDIKPKSKKEVMAEIILKSKMFKAQKAKDKEESERLIDELDKTYASLVESGSFLSLTLCSKNDTKAEEGDDYDELLGQMALEVRARPSDRTKTPEEIAQEERERLEHLEEDRKRRMLATDDYSDEDTHTETREKSRRMASGDDLGDLPDESQLKKGWIDEILEREHSEDGNSDSEDGEEVGEGEEEDLEDDDDVCKGAIGNAASGITMSLRDWEQSDNDNCSTDLEEKDMVDEDEDEKLFDGEMDHNIDDDVSHQLSEQGKSDFSYSKDTYTEKHASSRMETLPFVIEVPRCLDELSALVDGRGNAEILEAIDRIRKSNAISLGPENRRKMQVFYGVLLQYFAVSTSKIPLNAGLLNLLVKPLVEISFEIPYFAAICARERLLRIRSKFCEDVRILGKHCWPSLKTLMLLRLWSLIFPCSDFRHVVMTPALLVICECLMTCPVVTGRDAAVGSFLCSMILLVVKQSKKFCPEAVMFIHSLLEAATGGMTQTLVDVQFGSTQLKPRYSLLITAATDDVGPLHFFHLMDMPEDSLFFTSDNFRASILLTAIETLRGFVDAYEEIISFPEIFLPTSQLLQEISGQALLPASLQGKFKETALHITEKANQHHATRRPLQMRKKKPQPIKLLNPKFEENFVKGHDYDPDRERADRRKLKKLLKREERGAVRELRKDNYFLLDVKDRDKAFMKEERAEKYGKARAFLQEQEHAYKSGQLGKGRKKRRR